MLSILKGKLTKKKVSKLLIQLADDLRQELLFSDEEIENLQQIFSSTGAVIRAIKEGGKS